MHFLATLNPEQREAVLHVSGPLLILAGAGSGKTRVITSRIAYLVGDGHAKADEVLAVTFTNKAAEEMRTRVEALLGEDCSRMWVSTFHSLCARLLRREAPAIGLSRDFVIYDSSDQLTVVKLVLKELQIDDNLVQPRAALSRISHAKNRMESPEQMAASAGWNRRDELIAKIYAKYLKTLQEVGALDFDDLLLKTVQLFETAGAVRQKYSERFRFVMVDEYQDTNRPQYLLIRRFAEVHRNLCVVGDPDQSIYKWRGADLRNILDFENDFPEARIVKLEQNYRSTQVILDAASAVINQNRNRKDKHLWTDQKGGARILYFRGGDELEEADFITRTARSGLAEDPDAMAAILYRTNAQSRALEDALMREGLAYKIVGGVRFYERKEIKDALAYMRLVINPHDDVSLRRVINVPARGIGKGVMETLERVEVIPDSESLPLLAAGLAPSLTANSLWARLVHGLQERSLTGRAAAALTTFRDLIVNLTVIARQDSVADTIGKILDRSGYVSDLREERSEEAEARIENLAELVSAAREYESREPEPTLTGFVDRLSLLSDVDEEQGSRDARIWMMTLHSAKGLEFPMVIMAGLEEGLFPHSRSGEDEDELEEERRLCYVGMTRARKRLVLTGAARRRVFGEYQASQPSRFIDEVPTELVDRLMPHTSSHQSRFSNSYDFRPNPYGRGGRGSGGQVREDVPAYAYEDEDQSTGMTIRPGMRVRHQQFGVGNVISVEPLDGDAKLVVRFTSAGVKTLRAKFARLQPA
jgi:DNA helicase-2/ATP-dependent DNA helicase PcrA